MTRALTSRRPDFNLNANSRRILQKYGGGIWRRRHPALSKKLEGKVGRVDALFLFARGGDMLEELVADVNVTLVTRNN